MCCAPRVAFFTFSSLFHLIPFATFHIFPSCSCFPLFPFPLFNVSFCFSPSFVLCSLLFSPMVTAALHGHVEVLRQLCGTADLALVKGAKALPKEAFPLFPLFVFIFSLSRFSLFPFSPFTYMFGCYRRRMQEPICVSMLTNIGSCIFLRTPKTFRRTSKSHGWRKNISKLTNLLRPNV